MHREQEHHFQVLFQAQQEDRQVLWSLIVSADIPASVPVVTVGFPHVCLTKMGPPDDPEAFLEFFEAWLLLLLSGEAKLMAQQLPTKNMLEYQHLKQAILQCVSHTPEQHH